MQLIIILSHFFVFKFFGCHVFLLKQIIWILLIAYVFFLEKIFFVLKNYVTYCSWILLFQKDIFICTTSYDVFYFIFSHSFFCFFILYKMVSFTKSMSKKEYKLKTNKTKFLPPIRVCLSDYTILLKITVGQRKGKFTFSWDFFPFFFK